MSGRMPLPPIPTCPQEPWEKLRRRLTGTGVGSNFRFVADPTVATRLSGRGAAVALVALRQDASAQVRVPRALGSALTSLFPWELGGVQGTVGKLSASPFQSCSYLAKS
jgi:hypothetical protein